jgi:hypothetical protein
VANSNSASDILSRMRRAGAGAPAKAPESEKNAATTSKSADELLASLSTSSTPAQQGTTPRTGALDQPEIEPIDVQRVPAAHKDEDTMKPYSTYLHASLIEGGIVNCCGSPGPG